MSKADKRTAILRAAECVFADRRFHEVTLNHVAAAAHVGKGTIYLYFESKDDLFFQLVTERQAELERRLHEVAGSGAGVEEKLQVIAREMGDAFRRHHAARRFHGPEFLRSRPGARALIMAHHRRIGELVARVLREGMAADRLRGDLDVTAATCLFVGAVRGRDWHFLELGEDIPVEALVRLFMRGAAGGQ